MQEGNGEEATFQRSVLVVSCGEAWSKLGRRYAHDAWHRMPSMHTSTSAVSWHRDSNVRLEPCTRDSTTRG